MEVSQDLRQTLDELGGHFLQEFLEVELSRHPENVSALAELGQIYTIRGLWDRGLEVDRRLVKLLPTDSTAHYNLACSLSLLGRIEAALESLELAVRLGYEDADFMESDEDLSSLRGEMRFRALLEHIRTQSAHSGPEKD